ncbi:hypothetical protein OAJ61_01625 [bacterium]|nr:hypothetical protein [bacterium]
MAITRIQGTDGIRGPVCLSENSSYLGPMDAFLNEGILTEELFELYTYSFCLDLLNTGFAESNDIAVIGWDPRDSSGRFNQAAVNGIRKAGMTATVVDTLPTPAISMYQLKVGAACGFVLTASHNRADHNGIKIFLGHSNLKLLPEDDMRLTQYCLNLDYEEIRTAPLTGEISNEHLQAKKLFIDFFSDDYNNWMQKGLLNKVTVIVDAANGAFSHLVKDLLHYEGCRIEFLNCEPSRGINSCSGVADLEGISVINADEILDGDFGEYVALRRILLIGREHNYSNHNRLGMVFGFVFDGDGDRCFLLNYDPYNDQVKVLGGDIQAFLQAKLLKQKSIWNKPPLYLNTVESDIEAERAVKLEGFETKQCAVGDKWILWESFLSQWKCRKQYFLEMVDDSEFQALTIEADAKLEKMQESATFDAIKATNSVFLVEKWLIEKKRGELVNLAHAHACEISNNCFAIGSEESGHLITLGQIRSGKLIRPVYIGNGVKCALNSMAAVLQLSQNMEQQQYFQWLSNPYPSGYQKSLQVYYVDKSLLCEDSVNRKQLQQLLLQNSNWPEMETKIDQNPQEPQMLMIRVFQHNLPVAMVYVRNSGTEDKLGLYLRGSNKLAEQLDSLAKKVYCYLMISFKNKKNLMARAEKSILHSLIHDTCENIELIEPEFEKVPLDRLLNEMSTRQKLIEKVKGIWRITDLGRTLINHSVRSE